MNGITRAAESRDGLAHRRSDVSHVTIGNSVHVRIPAKSGTGVRTVAPLPQLRIRRS